MRPYPGLGAGAATAVTGMIDVSGTTPDQEPVTVRVEQVNGLLGTSLSAAEMQAFLEPIESALQAMVPPTTSTVTCSG